MDAEESELVDMRKPQAKKKLRKKTRRSREAASPQPMDEEERSDTNEKHYTLEITHSKTLDMDIYDIQRVLMDRGLHVVRNTTKSGDCGSNERPYKIDFNGTFLGYLQEIKSILSPRSGYADTQRDEPMRYVLNARDAATGAPVYIYLTEYPIESNGNLTYSVMARVLDKMPPLPYICTVNFDSGDSSQDCFISCKVADKHYIWDRKTGIKICLLGWTGYDYIESAPGYFPDFYRGPWRSSQPSQRSEHPSSPQPDSNVKMLPSTTPNSANDVTAAEKTAEKGNSRQQNPVSQTSDKNETPAIDKDGKKKASATGKGAKKKNPTQEYPVNPIIFPSQTDTSETPAPDKSGKKKKATTANDARRRISKQHYLEIPKQGGTLTSDHFITDNSTVNWTNNSQQHREVGQSLLMMTLLCVGVIGVLIIIAVMTGYLINRKRKKRQTSLYSLNVVNTEIQPSVPPSDNQQPSSELWELTVMVRGREEEEAHYQDPDESEKFLKDLHKTDEQNEESTSFITVEKVPPNDNSATDQAAVGVEGDG